MKPNNKNENEVIIPESVFGANADVAAKKPYTTKELLKARKPYYFICGILLVLICLFSILASVMTKKDTRSYKDYQAITLNSKSEQLNRPYAKYYVYYYDNTCSICSSIRPGIFDYIDQQDVYPSQLRLFLFNIEDGYQDGDEAFVPQDPSDLTNPDTYVGMSDAEKLVIGITPTLLTVTNGVVSKCDIGGPNVLKELGQ